MCTIYQECMRTISLYSVSRDIMLAMYLHMILHVWRPATGAHHGNVLVRTTPFLPFFQLLCLTPSSIFLPPALHPSILPSISLWYQRQLELNMGMHKWVSIFGLLTPAPCPPYFDASSFDNKLAAIEVFVKRIKEVLHSSLCIAFMFNGGQLPALTIHPIDTRVCIVHL